MDSHIKNGCETTDGVLIKVYRTLRMPNSFTPNNDGKNDIFRIAQGMQITFSDFSIFDRWGNRVFETQNSSNGWDGNFNGTPCMTGAYVYVIAGISGNEKVLFVAEIKLLFNPLTYRNIINLILPAFCLKQMEP